MSKPKPSGVETIMVTPPPKSSHPGTPSDSRPMTPINIVEKSPEVRLQIDDDRNGPGFPKNPSPKLKRPKTPPKKSDDILESTDCPFNDYGCEFRSDRHEVKKHIRDSNVLHISLLCDTIGPMKTDIMTKIEDSSLKLREAEDLEFRMTSISHLYSCQFVWPITDYNAKFRAAKKGTTPVVYSPPFLTHRGGYKICVSWAPFGDGDAVREHCSIFVSILKGEHDSILTWPFRCPITIKLLDQSKDKNGLQHVVNTLTPAILGSNVAFLGQPKSARNPSFGILKFVSVGEMKDGGRYLKNDVVYLAVDVDLSGIPAF